MSASPWSCSSSDGSKSERREEIRLADPAPGRRIHRVRPAGTRRDRPVFGERELERTGGVGVSRLPAQRSPGGTPHPVPPSLGREELREAIRNLSTIAAHHTPV